MVRFFSTIMVSAILGAMALMMSVAKAGDDFKLNEDLAKRFTQSLAPVQALAEVFEEEGVSSDLMIETRPASGEEFKPYSSAVSALNEMHPKEYARLKSVVKQHGFTPTEWGVAGDRVIKAYLAVKMDEENPGAIAQMKAIDKSMLAQMPAQYREQFERTLLMMSAVENTTEDDKKAIASVRDDLDQILDE